MADPLRLLVVGVAWPPETFLGRLFRGLLGAGVELTVACATRPGGEWASSPRFRWLRTLAWSGPRLLRVAHVGFQTCSALARDPRCCGQTWRSLRKRQGSPRGHLHRIVAWNRVAPLIGRRWDVIYCPWNSAAIDHLPVFDWGIPVVVSCRGSQVNVAPHNPERQGIRDGLRDTLTRAAAVHCVSDAMREQVLRFGVEPERIKVIRPAVDTQVFQPASASRDGSSVFRVVMVGTLTWRKGYEYALQSVKALVDRGVPIRLDVIGAGPERQRVLYTIDDLGLQDHVHLHGRLSPDDVRRCLQRSDVFLLATLSEGISNAALEAMACGLPVVTTDCGGLREAVTNGIEGYVVPTRDPAAMAAALGTLWRSVDQRVAMGMAGRRRIEQSFRLDQQIRQFVDLLRGVADRPPTVGAGHGVCETASCAE